MLILISKRDVKSAFKLVPASVLGLAYMGYRFAEFVGIDLALLFGWRRSPANWGVISTLLMQRVASYRPASPWRDGSGSFTDNQYVEDGAFVEPWAGIGPCLAPTLW